MLKSLRRDNPDVNEEDVVAFATKWGLKLPASYVQFLTTTNGGGEPEPDSFPIKGLQNNPFGNVAGFYGLRANHPMGDLEYMLADLPDSVPDGILPIGANGMGDDIILDLRKSPPPVMFWDRHPFWGNEVWKEEYLYFIAESFESFLACLDEYPDE